MSWSLLSQQVPLLTQVHTSACKSALVQASCGSPREELVGFPRIRSLKGRPLCHCFYIGGAAITQLGAPLMDSTSHVGPWSRMPVPWLALVCCGSLLCCTQMMSGRSPRGAWNWEETGLGGTGQIANQAHLFCSGSVRAPDVYNSPCSGLGYEGE